MPYYQSTYYKKPVEADDLILATAAFIIRILANHPNIDCISIEPGYAIMQKNGPKKGEFSRFEVRIHQVD